MLRQSHRKSSVAHPHLPQGPEGSTGPLQPRQPEIPPNISILHITLKIFIGNTQKWGGGAGLKRDTAKS